ncbi:MAG: T9SS type A sorting domain-containing protein [Ignavibacteria bacterium]|nr:T9SS type A sorting domain-containing protein [Ignavibacteria bacterium]
MKKTLFSFLLLALMAVTISAGNRDRSKVDKSAYGLPDEKNTSSVYTSRAHGVVKPLVLEGSFMMNGITIGPEILTQANGFYDYMTNGDCRKYIQVDQTTPSQISTIYTITDTNDVYPTASTRKTVYCYSTDGGLTWTNAGFVPNSNRTGFGNMILKPTGEAIIAMHAGTPNTQLHIDVAPQVATWTSYNANLPARLWPIQSIMSNGNILIAANQNTTAAPDSLVWAVFNGTTISNWNHLYEYGLTAVSNQRWASASGSSSSIIISNPVSVVDSLNNQFIRAFTTTNNGTSFSGPAKIFRPFVIGPQDTMAAFFGQDLTYKPGTNDWYFVVNAVASRYRTARLYLVRSTDINNPVLIADSNNVPSLFEGLYQTFAGVTGIDHPSLGWSSDGNILYCAYSVAQNDTGSRGWNTRDIFYSSSSNNGATWSAPTRITNTPTIDEGYPSVSSWNPGNSGATYELHISYMKDPGDGPSAFNAGQTLAPATRNFQIYRKITEAAGPIGINNISSEVPGIFSLEQNFPNPFNPVTKIRFAVPKASSVTLEVFDVTGKLVMTLAKNENVTAGTKEVEFNAVNLPSGVYFYTLKASDFSETKKMVLVK